MFKKKFGLITLLFCMILVMGCFTINTQAVSTVLLAVQGVIVDGNLVKFSGVNGLGVDTGVSATNVVKNKFDATAAPTVNNDTDEGYTVGSRWLDVTNDKSYICLDNSDGAAVWHLDVVGPGSSTDHAIVRWDSTTGRTVLNSIVTVSDTGVIAGGEWQGTVISPVYGGTGIANNVASTLTISGNFAITITVTNVTAITLPTAGIVVSDNNACTDLEGTKLSIAGGVLNCTETDSVVGAVTGIVLSDGGGNITASAIADTLVLYIDGATNIPSGEAGFTYIKGTDTLNVVNIVCTAISGTLTGTASVAATGDAAVDFFGAGVDAVVDGTECTDIEGTYLSIAAGVLNVSGLATVALDNLSGVAINTSLLSDTQDTDSLGSTAKEWLNLYIGDAGKIFIGLSQDLSIHRSAANTMTLTASAGVVTSAGLTVGGDVILGANSIGRDADNDIDFETDNQILFRTNGIDNIKIDSSGNIDMQQFAILIDDALGTDEDYSGIIDTANVGETVAIGDLLYYNWADSEWKKAKADAAATMPALRIALAVATDGNPCLMLVVGYIRDDTAYQMTGAMVYVSDATAGAVQYAPPADAGDQVQRVGVGITADKMFFCPSIDVGEI